MTANDSRETRLRGLLSRALDLEADDVPAFLEEVARDHPDLADTLRSRLMSDRDADDFERTIHRQAAQALGGDQIEPGDRIDRYRVIRQLGEGGMGMVFLVEDEAGRQASLKILKRGMDTDALLRRFDRERRILTGLDHPHIAQMRFAGSIPDGRPYFVMEYVDGVDIERYASERRLTVRDRLGLFLRVCEAVQYAHQQLVVHRDLKPANILVTPDGTPKLLDFGIAKLLAAEDGDAVTEFTVGGRFLTPEYASPEQVKNERITTASDVYSLSVLLYRLLTKRPPYEVSGGPGAVERAVCEDEPSPASAHDRRLRGDLDAILEMGLRKDPEERYGSVQALALDLRRHLAGEPISARKSSAWDRGRKFARRNPVLVALAGTLAVVAVAMSVQTYRIGRARDKAADAFREAAEQRDRAASERDHAEEMATLLAEVLSASDTDITYLESIDASSVRIGRGPFSVSAWIRVATHSPRVRTIVDKRITPYLQSRGFHFFTYDDRLGLQIADATRSSSSDSAERDKGSSNYVGSTSLADGRWHHVVASARRDPTDSERDRIVLYIDGEVERIVEGERVRRGDIDSPAPLRVGLESEGFHVAYPFQGSIENAQLFDEFLDEEEVAALFRRDRQQRPRLLAYLPSVTTVPSTGSGDAGISLLLLSSGAETRDIAWSVGGRPLGGSRQVGATRFEPTSGEVRLPPVGDVHAVPIRVQLSRGDVSDADSLDENPLDQNPPDGHRPHPPELGVQVMVGAARSGDRRVVSGIIRTAPLGQPALRPYFGERNDVPGVPAGAAPEGSVSEPNALPARVLSGDSLRIAVPNGATMRSRWQLRKAGSGRASESMGLCVSGYGPNETVAGADLADGAYLVAKACPDTREFHGLEFYELVASIPVAGDTGAAGLEVATDSSWVDVGAWPILLKCNERAHRSASPETPVPTAQLPLPLPLEFEARTRNNAFITDTAARFALTTPAAAHLEISNLRGGLVRHLELGRLQPGQHSVGWDGRDDNGDSVPPGLYAVRILADNFSVARWDDAQGTFVRRPQADLVRMQVFRVQ